VSVHWINYQNVNDEENHRAVKLCRNDTCRHAYATSSRLHYFVMATQVYITGGGGSINTTSLSDEVVPSIITTEVIHPQLATDVVKRRHDVKMSYGVTMSRVVTITRRRHRHTSLHNDTGEPIDISNRRYFSSYWSSHAGLNNSLDREQEKMWATVLRS